MKKLLWVRADKAGSWDARKKFVTTALESGADAVLVAGEDVKTARSLGKMKLVSESKDADIVLGKNAFYVEVKSKEDEQEAVKYGRKADYVIVNALDWKVIPLENIIAALQDARAKIIVEVTSEKEAKTALETLEVGADGVIVSGDFNTIKKVRDTVEEMSSEKLTLSTAEITRLEPVGMGDRVCVDTASMFKLGEGMLVGSQSNALFLVHSETLETEYVASRPFRVNAGPVHAYARVPEGKTKYLSDLSAGDEVLAVDWKGNTRKLILGRSKIEKRPLILVEAKADGKKVTTLLQNAETILLVNKKGKPVSISRLKEGDEVLVYLEDAGRHFGMKIKESIKEK
ncbi:MAG: 3-dehydroquinate synthase II [Candidatus Altiarchaeota archaeon]